MSISNIKLSLTAMSAGLCLMIAGSAGAATCSTGGGGSSATLSLTAASNAECFLGNDTNTINSSFAVFGLTNWILADKNEGPDGDQSIVFTQAGPVNDVKSGNWGISTLGTAANVMVNLKAGNGWGSFLVNSLGGSWTSTKDLSHASIYYRAGNPTTPIPLPAAGWMLLAGLGGLVAAKRRRRAKH